MSKILFTHSYFYRFDSKQWKAGQPYPPYGTLIAANFLRQAGHEVSLFDTNLASHAEEIIPTIQKKQPDYLVIYDDGFNYLTKMCLTKMREAAFSLSKIGKSNGCIVIVCSSDATDHFAEYLDQGVDFIIPGEGEISLAELVRHLEKGNNLLDDVPGLIFRKNGKTIQTEKRKALNNLDDLPLAAWDLVNMNDYQKIWQNKNGYFSLNIATTRGCPFKCNWCAKPIYGNRYNSRSPEKVVDEIEFLLKTFHPDHFWMSDDIFGLKPGWVQQFRNIILKRKLKFKYKIQSRVDLLLKEDTINALVDSGIDTVWVGAESGSQKILDAMDKGTTVEQIYSATKLLKSKGVKVGFFLQFGYLGETKEDINQTIQMLMDLMPDDIGVSVSYPLPGTKFYDKVKNDLKRKTNWEDSDDLAMMYHSTFSSDYYKRLHRYIHKQFRKKQGYENIRILLKSPLTLNYAQTRSALSTLYYIPASIADAFRLSRLETTPSNEF